MKQYNFTINGNSYGVTINSVEGNIADVTVTASYRVELTNGGSPIQIVPAAAAQAVLQEAAPAPQSAAAPAPAAQPSAAPAPAPQPAPAPTPAPQSAAAPSPAPASAAGGKGTKVVAPLPGNIVGISVKVGDAVKAGQQVATLEAMKMENSIESPVAGTVTEILAAVGDAVAADAPILTIA